MSARRVLEVVLVIAGAFAIAAVCLRAAGLDPREALTALVGGAFGSSWRIGVSLARTSPLLLTGLAVALAFRAGLWNIGAEGQFLAGALVAVWLATRVDALASGWAPLPLLMAATVAGGAVGAVSGLLRVLRNVPEVISTILLNYVVIELRSWAVLGPLRERAGRYPQTDAVSDAARLGTLGVVPAGLLFGVLAAILLHVAMHRSRRGLEIRALGLSPGAARALGVPAGPLRVACLALSGALCGLAGGAEVLGSIGRIHEGYAPGYGYTAIAVALLGRLEPLLVIPAAALFGGLTAGAESMERVAQVPAAVSLVVQALVVLGAVALWRRSREAA